jgi:hypothetical protein
MFVVIGASLFAMASTAVRLFVVIPINRRTRAKDFDFIQSARRIRARPLMASDRAETLPPSPVPKV